MSTTQPRALLAFDQSTAALPTLETVAWSATRLPLTKEWVEPVAMTEIDLFALLVDAKTGISKSMISAWHYFQDRQVPRLLLVQGIEFSSTDFDDIVMIGNRVLEKFATPFLVLHHQDGSPIGLIDIVTGHTRDYSGAEIKLGVADIELENLVKDFRDEFLEEFAEIGESGFAAGIYPIAFPITRERKIGILELNDLLATLPKL